MYKNVVIHVASFVLPIYKFEHYQQPFHVSMIWWMTWHGYVCHMLVSLGGITYCTLFHCIKVLAFRCETFELCALNDNPHFLVIDKGVMYVK